MIYILGLIAGLVHKGKGCQKSQCCSLAAASEPSQLREQGGAGRNTVWEGNHLPSPALAQPLGRGAGTQRLLPTTWKRTLIIIPGRKRAGWKWIRAAKEPRRGTFYFSIFLDSLDAVSHFASVFHPYIFMEDLWSPAGIHFVFFGWSCLQNLTPLIVRMPRCWGIVNGQILHQGEGTIINVRSWMQCLWKCLLQQQ